MQITLILQSYELSATLLVPSLCFLSLYITFVKTFQKKNITLSPTKNSPCLSNSLVSIMVEMS